MISEQYELKFPSRPEKIALVESFIDNICEELDIDEAHYGNVLVAVTEAVNNAINHGNAQDASKMVEVYVEEDKQTLTFIVKDQGSGFDYDNLPDPTAPENLEKPTGRGIFLMKQLADNVDFEEKGRIVKVGFKVKQ